MFQRQETWDAKMSLVPGTLPAKDSVRHRKGRSIQNANGDKLGSELRQQEGQNGNGLDLEPSLGRAAYGSKAERSNQARLVSMKMRNAAWRRKQQIVQEATKRLSSENKKTVFQEENSDDKDGKPTLLGEDDVEEEADLSWPDMDNSEARTKMLLQQAKIGPDPRFRMNDKFLADFEAEGAEGAAVDEMTKEAQRQQSIAEKVADSIAPFPPKADNSWNSTPAKKGSSGTSLPIGVRYDPDNPKHKQFELQSSSPASRTNGEVSVSFVKSSTVRDESREKGTATPVTLVTVDPEFTERLKSNEWNDNPAEPFSLLAAFGRTEVQEDPSENQHAPEDVAATTSLNPTLLEIMGAEPKNEDPSTSGSPRKKVKSASTRKGEKFFFDRNDRQITENMKKFRYEGSVDNLRETWRREQSAFRATSKRRWIEARRQPRDRTGRR